MGACYWISHVNLKRYRPKSAAKLLSPMRACNWISRQHVNLNRCGPKSAVMLLNPMRARYDMKAESDLTLRARTIQQALCNMLWKSPLASPNALQASECSG